MRPVEPETFIASRLTEGNFLFPTRIVLTEHAVMRRKRSWLRVSEESISLGNVASVNITTGVLWSDIRIESTGGSSFIESHGHSKQDARRLKQLIETLQSGGERALEDDLRPCPHCAEPIRRAAKVCRFCGRDLA